MNRNKVRAAAAVLAGLGLAACGSSGPPADTPPPPLAASCGVTTADGQTGISVILWQPLNEGRAVHVRQVTADWYGSKITVDVNRDVPWMPGNGYIQVKRPVPQSMWDNDSSKGCKILSWR